MIRGMPRRHAAVQYAVFDPQSREMRIASAGMPYPVHISRRGCRLIEIVGIPPGLYGPTVTYETSKILLEEGDSVLFCTDGILDAFDSEGESFGVERMQTICETRVCDSPVELLERIFSAVERFTFGRAQHDYTAAAVFHDGRD